MTFADLAQKILGEATTPDPRGLVNPSTFRGSPALRPDKDKGLRAGRDAPGAGGVAAKKQLRNAFRLLRNDSDLANEVNSILADYASKRMSISHEDEVVIRNNIANIDDNSTKLNNYAKALQDHNEGKAVLSDPDNVKSKIQGLKKDIADKKEELKAVLDKVEFYAEDNEILEQNLRKKLVRVVKQAAQKLTEKISTPQQAVTQVNSLDQLDKLVATDEELQQQETKLAVLNSLTQESPQNNILLRFLDLFLNKYEDYKGGLSMSGPLATIELNKEFNRLPLSVFANFYNSSVKDASEIKLLPASKSSQALAGGFRGSQAGKKAVSPVVMQAKRLLDSNFGSAEQGVLIRALNMFNQGGAGPNTMNKLRSVVKDIIDGVEGSPARLASIIYGNEGPITESFSQLAEYYITEAKKGARCTKVTGQQSSSRSDKKYSRCVKTPTGYKRVHYGDPNLRIKKSNPKKRKSFRARHKCSSAKPGTAKYYSCKNWSIIGFLAPAGLLLNSLCDYLPF
jgi:hypothetical protein